MAIQYVGGVKGGRAGSTGTTTQSLSGTLSGGLASSPATGDLVIILIGVASASGYAPTTLAVSGWTNGTFRSNTGVTNYSYQQYSYKFMGSTPDTEITIPSTGNTRNAQSWAVHVFRNVHTTNTLDVAVQNASGTASGRPNPPAVTPTTAGAWILWLGASAAATGAEYTAPTDFSTNWLTQTNVDNYDSMVGFGYYTGWTANQYDPAAITAGGTTGSTDSWVAETLVLRPGIVNINGTATVTNAAPVVTGSGKKAGSGTAPVGNTNSLTATAKKAVGGSAGTLLAVATLSTTPAKGASGSAGTLSTATSVTAAGAKGGQATVAATLTATMESTGYAVEPEPHSGSASITEVVSVVATGVKAYTMKVYPNVILYSSHLSGAYTDIDDDPNNPDGSWLLFAA